MTLIILFKKNTIDSPHLSVLSHVFVNRNSFVRNKSGLIVKCHPY